MSRLMFAAVLLLAMSSLSAQGPKKEGSKVEISAKMLISFHNAGLGLEHIHKVLDRNGVPTFDVEALREIEKAGLPQDLMKRLQKAAHRPATPSITVESIIQMVKAGVSPQTIIVTIRNSGAMFALTPQDVVDLILKHDVPGNVVKAMTTPKVSAAAATKAEPQVKLEDILRYTAAGMSSEWILNRIRKTNSHFQATPDDLIQLSRNDVHSDVLGEIWNRSSRAKNPDVGVTTQPSSTEEPIKAETAAITFRTHVDEGLGFSLIVPTGWPVHKERKGPNDLLSFSDQPVQPDGGLADQEIQVARFRASHPERLTDTNLLPIARNFVNALRSNFQSRGVTMTSEEAGRTWLSGRSAVAWRVTTTMKEGPTLQGHVFVTWDAPYVYMLSYATRAELPPERRKALARCIKTFAIEKPAPKIDRTGTEREQLTRMFESWRDAIQKRNFVIFRNLHAPDATEQLARGDFVDLSTRLTQPDRRVALGDVRTARDELKVTYRLIDPNLTTFGILDFKRTPGGIRLLAVKPSNG